MTGRAQTRGERNIAWIENYCHIPEGRDVGKKVKLRKFQRQIIKDIYDTPTRRAIISFGRKNAKTTLAAFLCLLHTCGPEAKPNSQLYSAAQSRDQAGIIFELMCQIIRQSPELSTYCHIRESAKVIVCEELGARFRALSSDATTAYGFSPVFIVHDELGQVVGPRSKLYEALETAAGAQIEPLSIIISTQAPTDGDLLSVLIDDAQTKADPRTKLFLWTADKKVDPFSEEALRQANPAYGDFLNEVEVKDQADSAKRMPSREADYRNLILNQRVNVNNPFISKGVWDLNSAEPRLEDFQAGVFAAIDLSELVDLTALVFAGKGEDGQISIGAKFFTPSEGIAERSIRDRVPYDLWVEQGFITATPGASIDYSIVANALVDFNQTYGVEQVTYDRWGMKILRSELGHINGGDEVPLDEKGHGQGTHDMTPALLATETEFLNGNVRHGNHPVLTWCAANAVVFRGPAGDRKLNKAKSTGRIDGMVALVMAMNRLMGQEKPEVKKPSRYLDPNASLTEVG